MLIIGLTGPTGSGKSTVSEHFSACGFYVINCDDVARKAVCKGSECLNSLEMAFGSQIINEDKTLNRKKLAELAFSSKEKTELLNSIEHPFIISLIKDEINAHKNENILLDAPTLFESGANALCDKIISVVCDFDKRKERIIKRDNLSSESANLRLSAQKDNKFFVLNSDFVIENNSTTDALKEKTEQIIISLGVKI